MRDFIFHNPVKIYFGKGQACHIAQEVERVEGAVLVVYGGGSIKRNGAYDDVMAALAGTGCKIIELPGVTPNPRLDKALEGVRLVKEHGVGLILAVGGGSVIDCAKFISLGSGIGDDEDLWDDYIETGKPAPEGLIPVGVVLTTARSRRPVGMSRADSGWRGAHHRGNGLGNGRCGRAYQLGTQPQARLYVVPADAQVLRAGSKLPDDIARRTDGVWLRGHVLPHV